MPRWTEISKNWKCSGKIHGFNSLLLCPLQFCRSGDSLAENHFKEISRKCLYTLTRISIHPKVKNTLTISYFFIYMCRLEMMDWQGQAELLKQQTLTTLSDRDQQVRQLTAMLEEARASKLRHEQTQRQVKSYNLIFKYEILEAA